MRTTTNSFTPSTTAAMARHVGCFSKDNLTDKAYSFDASLLPDGGYTVKVVASDAPSHSPGEALTASKESRRFEVDTTPPRIENLAGTLEGDSNSRYVPRSRWFFSHQTRRIFGRRGRLEVRGAGRPTLRRQRPRSYDFKATSEAAKDGGASSEHVVVVRVYDRYDNMGAAKTLVPQK
jgi:hypothetical protein